MNWEALGAIANVLESIGVSAARSLFAFIKKSSS
jgi:hypothetical protein